MNNAVRRQGHLNKAPWCLPDDTEQNSFRLRPDLLCRRIPNIVTVTPAGRARYMDVLSIWIEIFHQHITKNYPTINHRHVWWINTENPNDAAYIKRRCSESKFESFEELKVPYAANGSIYTFFKNCCDPDTVYIRMDDDVCYAPPQSIFELYRTRVMYKEPFLILGNIVNNSLCAHLHHRMGIVGKPPLGFGQYFCTDGLTWGKGEAAEFYHRSFLESLRRRNHGHEYKRDMLWQLHYFERFSINVISWLGKDMADIWGSKDGFEPDEEYFLTVEYPTKMNRPNAIDFGAVFSHFAYGPQRDHMDTTDLLVQYMDLALHEKNDLSDSTNAKADATA